MVPEPLGKWSSSRKLCGFVLQIRRQMWGLYFDQGLAPLAARPGDESVYCSQNKEDGVSFDAPPV